MLRKGRLCTDADHQKCLDEHDEAHLEWACANCEKRDELHPYTRKLLQVRLLQKAGYPMTADFLTYNEWLDLGKVNQCLETRAPLP